MAAVTFIRYQIYHLPFITETWRVVNSPVRQRRSNRAVTIHDDEVPRFDLS